MPLVDFLYAEAHRRRKGFVRLEDARSRAFLAEGRAAEGIGHVRDRFDGNRIGVARYVDDEMPTCRVGGNRSADPTIRPEDACRWAPPGEAIIQRGIGYRPRFPEIVFRGYGDELGRQSCRVRLPHGGRAELELGARIARKEGMPAESERKCHGTGVGDLHGHRQRVRCKREDLSRAKMKRPLACTRSTGVMDEAQLRCGWRSVQALPRSLPAVAMNGVRHRR